MIQLRREQRWECPNCDLKQVTHEPLPHVRMHPCRGKNGFYAPMVPAGVRCKVELVEREDYIGKELVQTDASGRPVMAAVTTRDTGVDVAVYAPVASSNGHE